MLVTKSINIRSINILGQFRMEMFSNIDLPFLLYKPIRMFYKCFIIGGQTVKACLYYNLLIRESDNISETVEKCWPTSLFRNMVIKKKKASTNLTYTGYILDNNIGQQVDIVCLPLQSVLGSATWRLVFY